MRLQNDEVEVDIKRVARSDVKKIFSEARAAIASPGAFPREHLDPSLCLFYCDALMMSLHPTNPSIAILGAGAIGSYYGGRLAQHGHNVHFLLRSDYPHVRAHGLRIKSIAGDFALTPEQLRVYNRARDVPKADLVIITLKSTDNDALLDLVGPLLRDGTTLITLQNGLGNEEFLAAHFPAQPILGGIAFTCINRISPGVIHHSDHGHIHVGAFQGPSRGGAQGFDPKAIRDLFRESGIATEVVDNLLTARWSKLTWNIPFNGLGALLDLSTDRLLAAPEGESLVRSLIAEVRAIASADGHPLSPDMADRQIALTRSMGAYYSSTQLDRRNGRPMEIGSIFARPLAIARSHKIRAPHLEFLTKSLEILANSAATKID